MELLVIIGVLVFIVIILTLVGVIKNQGYNLGQSELITILFSKYIEYDPEDVIEKIGKDISSLSRLIRNNYYYGYWSDNGRHEGKKEMLEKIETMLEDFVKKNKKN
ncbi:MAG: hypothetical protein NTY12_05035 [Candidatus Falkowbacteria bacterium]|nr:hypothetical protein [Candidatus Falkowbacteria bacterium]